jgi:hypothetical protein
MAHNILGFINRLKKDVNNLIHSCEKKFRALMMNTSFFSTREINFVVCESFVAMREMRMDGYLKNGVKTHSSCRSMP